MTLNDLLISPASVVDSYLRYTMKACISRLMFLKSVGFFTLLAFLSALLGCLSCLLCSKYSMTSLVLGLNRFEGFGFNCSEGTKEVSSNFLFLDDLVSTTTDFLKLSLPIKRC